jgi:hypothetical protein
MKAVMTKKDKPRGRQKGVANLLVGQKKTFVINMLAQFKTAKETAQLLHEVHGILVSDKTIGAFKQRNELEIATARQRYLSKIDDVPIASEKVRLERDESLYQLSQTLDDPKDKVTTGLQCLQEAREETKGGSVTFNQYNQQNVFTDAELLHKIKETEERVVLLSKQEKDGVYAVEQKR